MKDIYVAGFLFSQERDFVALIEKTKPEWQKGYLNGIGGKIESYETAYEAMVREFAEETGAHLFNWRNFCTLNGLDWKVYFFVAFGDLSKLQSTTEEKVTIVPIDKIQELKTIANLKWLVPMALQDNTNADVWTT